MATKLKILSLQTMHKILYKFGTKFQLRSYLSLIILKLREILVFRAVKKQEVSKLPNRVDNITCVRCTA